MALTRIILRIVVGAIASGIALSIFSYYAALNYGSGGGGFFSIGVPSDWWFVLVFFAAILGVIVGGISGGIIAGFYFSFWKAVLFGAIFNSLLVIVIYILTDAGNYGISDDIKYTVYSLIPIGIINAIAVSLVSSWQQSLK